MRDCPNAEMRDALPDLMHGTLPPQRQAEVRAHLDACDACRAELALLARVRGAVSAPAVATDRIVSTLPRYQRQSSWRRMIGNRALRIAAAVVLLAGGASLVLRDAGHAPESVVVVSSARSGTPAELALGETFADVSDSALVALVEAIEDLDATLSEEPESITVPLAPVEGL
jgi:predicted anti-sigma-YlaC factor YlaD